MIKSNFQTELWSVIVSPSARAVVQPTLVHWVTALRRCAVSRRTDEDLFSPRNGTSILPEDRSCAEKPAVAKKVEVKVSVSVLARMHQLYDRYLLAILLSTHFRDSGHALCS